jgi:flagellar hook assembly protein FlgD
VVYDVAGRLVRTLVDEERPAGAQVVEWDGRDDEGRSVGNGIYFYAMQAGAWQSQKRMTLVK